MKRYFFSLVKHFLFWFLVFAVGRLLFLLANIPALTNINFWHLLSTFTHALKLDLSTICYLMVLPFLCLTLQSAFKILWMRYILKAYTLLFLLITSIIILSDISIYSEWSYKLNYKALVYLQHPSEIIKTATNFQLIISIVSISAITFLSFWIYQKWILRPLVECWKRLRGLLAIFWIIGNGLLLIGMRGGIGETPISQSDCFFSQHQILNDAAVNPSWNLLHSCLNFSQLNKENPFVFMDDEKAKSIVDSLYMTSSDSCIKVVKTDSVNIVVVLLESWSADLVESLGGRPGITPYFKELEKEGLLFTNMYSNGHRSQQGISALLSGFPPVPITSITDNFEKFSQLNSLANNMNDIGYSTSFYFAGDLNYGNLKAYLLSMKFNNIIDYKCFPKSTPRGKLSIFDQEMLQRHHHDMNLQQQPFFSVAFTASTHSPYDEPKIVEQLDWDIIELPYLNAAKYTDFCLGEYFEKVKQEPWYRNTLFILVADHSHVTYNNWDYHTREYQHIPMLWLGGALNDSLKGCHYDKLCSHLDLPKTILHQLNINATDYVWSNDIFNPNTQEFAMVEHTKGIAWIRKNHYLSYNGFEKKIITEKGSNDSLNNDEEQAKAFLQLLYDTYLKY
ncbi:MAG: LTA synthase family protein [Bacteroidales bacterium]|nr:LTA synthase family protein [Bacteroidales bacterium]